MPQARSANGIAPLVLSVPRLPPAHQPRPRLIGRLREEDCRLRLLCAPAGFGKSVLIGEFLRERPAHEQIIWLGLAGQPLSTEQLLLRVATALTEQIPALPPGQALLQLFSQRDQPIWLVLDDYPAHPSPELDACIDLLLSQPLDGLHLLVSTRQRPDWNLPRLLLAGELLELDSADLAFDRNELERLIQHLAPHTSPEQRDQLWTETAGWCAGVRLLLSQHGPQAIAGTHGSGHWLRDYLEHELLQRLGPDERECLYALAHLPKVSVELCQQLWEEGEGARLFEQLLRRHAFFQALDEQGHWYRLLPAVAQALCDRLTPTAATQLHLRACRLFVSAGLVEEAVEQALCAGQPEVAAAYLERLSQEWLAGEQHLAHLLAWRERLPTELLESTPRLLSLNAWALLLSWRLEEADPCIAKLARFLPQPDARRNRKLLANWQALRGCLLALRGDPGDAARQHCQAALTALPDEEWMPKLLCYSALAHISMAGDEPDNAVDILRVALELARRQGSLLFETLLNLDRLRLLLLRGELSRAHHLLQQSFALLGRRQTEDSMLLGRLHLLEAELHLLQGRLDEAEPPLRAGLRQAIDCADPFALHGYLTLAELCSRRGDFDEAFLHLREAERQMHCGQVWRYCYRGAQLVQSMRVLARQGRWERIGPIAERIQRYFDEPNPWLAPPDYPALSLNSQLLHARSLHAEGRLEEAEQRLLAVLEKSRQRHFNLLACDAQLALADISRSLHRETAATLEQQAREEALEHGWYGLLSGTAAVTAGPIARHTAPDLSTVPPASTLLSQREQAVLQLLAEGFSNQEIGNYLFISVNTVKTHTKKINSKLGVKRRTQAIMRAKTLGLLN